MLRNKTKPERYLGPRARLRAALAATVEAERFARQTAGKRLAAESRAELRRELRKCDQNLRALKRSKTPQERKTANRRARYNRRVKVWLTEPGNSVCRVYLLSDDFVRECNKKKIWNLGDDPDPDMVRRLFLVEATQCHHRRGRRLTKGGDLLFLEKEWLPVSAAGHEWIERNKKAAQALGLLAPAGQYDTWPDGEPSNL